MFITIERIIWIIKCVANMIVIDTSLMIVTDTCHLMIFIDTPQIMVMIREDDIHDMKATHIIIGCVPLQWWQVHIKRTFLIR